MSQNKTSYSAKYISYKMLNSVFYYRRLNFIDVKNSNGEIVKDCICIDESESLKIMGYLNKGDIVSFTADIVDLNNIEFCYPHGLYRNK